MKERLKQARKAAGKTQKEIAGALGITESTYCGYETGKRQPDAVKVAAIAAALGVSGDYILDIPETIKPEKPNSDTPAAQASGSSPGSWATEASAPGAETYRTTDGSRIS